MLPYCVESTQNSVDWLWIWFFLHSHVICIFHSFYGYCWWFEFHWSNSASKRANEWASKCAAKCVCKTEFAKYWMFPWTNLPTRFWFFLFLARSRSRWYVFVCVCVYVILFLVRVMPKVNILCSFFSFSVYKRSTCIFIVVVLTLLVACVLISPSQPSAQVGRFENINVCLFFVFCLLLFIYAALFLVDEQDSKTTF